ncbi:amidohydrolase family protein [Streptomyces sp. YS-B37]|uniref:amidohydrolase family protein n=1 Tax=Streptomyces sp. YS-B37 TaxID=3407669 RepID=UPI003B5142A4
MTDSARPPAHETARDPLLLRSVTVVDTRTGSLTPDTDVLVRDGRITEVRPGIEAPPRAAVVDARNRYVVPGYNDMHAHPLDQLPARSRDRDLRLLLAYGVTGFRQMSGSLDLLRRRADGTLDLPLDGARPLTMPGAVMLTPLNAGTPEQATATVREQHAAGADFIKVALATPPVFFAAQAEARRLGLTIVGHLPEGIDVAEASRLGMKSIEHLGPGVGLFACCSTDQDGVRPDPAAGAPKLPVTKLPFMDRLVDRMVKRMVVNPITMAKPASVERMRRAVDTYDAALAHLLAARFVDDDTWQVPTLIRVKTQELADDPDFAEAPELRHMDAPTLKRWRQATGRFEKKFPAAARATFRELYERQLQLTHAFDEAGVPMLTGSDTSGAGWVVPGASLHREFDELGRAGLSALRILQMTTLRAAEFLGTTDTMGTVEPGRLADLVLLDANPVERVENLHRVVGVVRDGRHYAQDELSGLKDGTGADL